MEKGRNRVGRGMGKVEGREKEELGEKGKNGVEVKGKQVGGKVGKGFGGKETKYGEKGRKGEGRGRTELRNK